MNHSFPTRATRTPRRSPFQILPLALGAGLVALAACGGGEPTDAGASAQGAAAAPQPATAKAPAAQPAPQPQPGVASAQPANAAPPSGALASTGYGPAGHSEHDGHDHGAPSAASSTLSNLPSNAKLEVDTQDHDFGTRVEGEVLSHTYAMKSSGEGDLVITTAKPTCGCTVSRVEVKAGEDWKPYNFGDALAPGTELRLTAELDTKNKKNIAQSKINIFCNDPRGTVTLGLTASLDTYFHIAPSSIEFGELSVADVAERSFEVSGKQPGAFGLALDDKPLPEGFVVELTPIDPTPEGKAERWRAKVTLGPDAREGNLGFPISMTSDQQVAGAKPANDGSLPHYGATVMATARIRGLISWEPQYLSFGLVRPGQVVSRTFTVTSFDPAFSFGSPTWRFVGPNDSQPEFAWADSFSAAVRPTADNKGLEVELTLNGLPDEADGSFQGRLILETGHTAKPEVPVLFSGVCRPGPPGR